jgi:hypothetical protein
MPSDPLVSYYLELTTDGNKVHGYSITGYKDGNRLKAKVEGYYTTPSDLFIREIASLDGPISGLQAYCYFSAHLKLTILMNGRQRWNGPFESRETDGTPCRMGSGGVMTVIDNAPPLEDVPKPKPEIKKVEVPKPIVVRSIPKDTPKPVLPRPAPPKPVLPKPEPPKPVVQKPKDTAKPIIIVQQPAPKPVVEPEIPDSCQRTYHWNSPELVLDVWDGWTIDGDVVSMTINGHQLLDHKKLSEKKERFTVPLLKGLNVLYINLHEEGFDPPNTPNLTLFDGAENHELSVSGNPGDVARICIWRK